MTAETRLPTGDTASGTQFPTPDSRLPTPYDAGDVFSPDASSLGPLTIEEDVSLQTGERLMTLNMGPQHPSTHGVLRVVLKLDGELITECDPVIGYLHRGTEKLGEHHRYAQVIPWTDRTDYVAALRPLLNAVGMRPDLTVVLFTLDETSYARELAPLAGAYPCLRLGPAWWFHDSPEGMRRFREMTTETACFYNTVGFNDDTRAYLSIPARHDMARRIDCGHLARLVAEHRLDEDEAHDLAHDLAYGLAKAAYKL